MLNFYVISWSNFQEPVIDAEASPEDLKKALEWELKLDSRDLRSHAWYHGTIPRPRGEELLQDDGDFLIRDCISQPGDFVLTCYHSKCPLHFVINKVSYTLLWILFCFNFQWGEFYIYIYFRLFFNHTLFMKGFNISLRMTALTQFQTLSRTMLETSDPFLPHRVLSSVVQSTEACLCHIMHQNMVWINRKHMWLVLLILQILVLGASLLSSWHGRSD